MKIHKRFTVIISSFIFLKVVHRGGAIRCGCGRALKVCLSAPRSVAVPASARNGSELSPQDWLRGLATKMDAYVTSFLGERTEVLDSHRGKRYIFQYFSTSNA